jgi:hypothetical protein
MSQALHILRKDIRRLRWDISAVLALAGLYTWMACRDVATASAGSTALVLLGWIYLAVRVVLEEPLPGDRQFWVTRPYGWKSLLGAKALFALAFLNLPLLISDCMILWWHGFPPLTQVSGLLWKQAMFVAFTLPLPLSVAAISRNLVQAIGFFFAFAIASFLPQRSMLHGEWNWGGDWMQETLSNFLNLAAAALILRWQYQRRATSASRAVYVASLGLVTLNGLILRACGGFAFPHLSGPPPEYSSVRLVFDQSSYRKHHITEAGAWAGAAPVLLPIHITGLREDLNFHQDGIRATIESPDGRIWKSGWVNTPSLFPLHGPWIWVYVDYGMAQAPTPVRLRLSVALTLLRGDHTVVVESNPRRFDVPNIGHCFVRRTPSGAVGNYLDCVSARRRPGRVLVYNLAPSRDIYPYYASSPQYSPFPANEICPVFRLFWDGTGQTIDPIGTKLKFVTERPVAHLIRELDIPRIRLSDYTVPQH